ncbi:MAG: phosphoribosyltransferase [Methanoregulaceae archaeon]|nr:phosphoribosyltransferase [Methanoregulaceae archaeon]
MGTVTDDPRLRNREQVFLDRHEAGRRLGEFVKGLIGLRRPVVAAIPAGGVPVGIGVARETGAPLVISVVRKIAIPWNPEAGFGAIGWDEQVCMNDEMLPYLHLTDREIDAAIEKTLGNVRERVRKFGGEPAGSLFAGGAVLLTDDGLASGYTMMAAIRATRRMRPAEVIVAVPTASDSAVRKIAPLCDRIVCLNIRSGSSFAVASAYREWHDLTDEEVYSLLSGARMEGLIPDKY